MLENSRKMTLSEWQLSYKDPEDLIIQASVKDGSDSWQEFPIGMSWQYVLCDTRSKALQIGNHNNTVLCCVNTSTDSKRRASQKNRISIIKTLQNNSIHNNFVSAKDYFENLPNYKFIISPEGNGIDCHRHYEALIAGCIPIIENNHLIREKYRGLPILYTEDYSEINEEYLIKKYLEMKDESYDFSRLFLSSYNNEQKKLIYDCGNYWTTLLAKKSFYKPNMMELLTLNKSLTWITLINYGYIDYTKNFLKSMEKANIHFNLIIFCIDDMTFNELNGYKNSICIKADFLKDLPTDMKVWGNIEYKKIVFAKLNAILYTLKHTFDMGVENIGYIDTDIVLFSDPTPIILDIMDKNKTINVFAQCDERENTCSNTIKCGNLCTGVIVFRNIKDLYCIFDYTEHDINSYPSDQQFLSYNLEKHAVTCLTIDKGVFPNGSFFTNIKTQKITFPEETSLIHFNWMVGNDKRNSMKLQNLWFIEEKPKKIGILIKSGCDLFGNGMIQNAYFLYQCLEKCGHICEFVCYDENPRHFQHKGLVLKTISAKPLIFNPSDYKAIITVSEGLDRDIYESLKQHKVATVALVCGCTMMMDQEYFYNMNARGSYISTTARVDEVWIIPSHKYMLDYIEIIRGVPSFIVPHLWSSECIRESMLAKYKKSDESLFYNITNRKNKKINIIIMESNMFIVKTSWIPIVIAEKLHKKYPDLINEVFVFCYPENEHAAKMIASLSIAPKVRKFKRLPVPEILDHFNNISDCYPIFLTTQLYNSLNYVYYELLYYGYPLIHNSLELDGLGYYYPEYDITKGVECILKAHKYHDKEVNILKDKAKTYLERVNPLNTDVCKTVDGLIASALVNANK